METPQPDDNRKPLSTKYLQRRDNYIYPFIID